MRDTADHATGDIPAVPATRFAFSGAAGDVLRRFLHRDRLQAHLSKKFRAYYRLRPWIPLACRQRLQQSRNHAIRADANWYLPTELASELRSAVCSAEDALEIHPWPDDFQMSACLTHDVETAAGMAGIDKLAAVEERFGVRSAWNLIPHKYRIDAGLVARLKERGHEIGIHGYNHDGRLFESRRTFNRRVAPINRALASYGATGFRAPMVHRNLCWLQDLNIEYDASCFDHDPFQAMPGGVGGVWPFIAGKFVELPYTLPQDHTLLVSLGETSPRIWIEKFAALRRLAGMAMLITHPDYLDTPPRLALYQRFLEHLVEQSACWLALPCQIARWWRQRDQLAIAGRDGSAELVGPAAERGRMLALADLST